MPVALFDHYESEYLEISKRIAQRLDDKNSKSPSAFRAVEEDLLSAKQILDQMEVETMSLEGNPRLSGLTRLKTFRNDLGHFRDEASKVKRERKTSDIQDARARLFSDFNGDVESGMEDPSQRLLTDAALLDTSNIRLDRTQRMALEAEAIGASVLSDLRRQREQIQHASRALQDTDHDLDTSNRLLRQMIKRMRANKLMSMAILVLLIIAILIVTYFKLFH